MTTATKVLRVQREPRVTPERPEPPVQKALRDPLELRDLPDLRVRQELTAATVQTETLPMRLRSQKDFQEVSQHGSRLW